MTRRLQGAVLLLLALGISSTRAHGQEPESTPPIAFWKTVGDTTLERLIGEVVKSNHDVVAVEAGRGNEFDSERARTQLNSTLAAIPALEASVSAVDHRIAVLVGHEVTGLGQEVAGAGGDDHPALPALPDSIVVPNPDVAVRRRPDVRSAERQLAAGHAFVGAGKGGELPRITVGSGRRVFGRCLV